MEQPALFNDPKFSERIKALVDTFEKENLRFVTVDCPKRVITNDAARDAFSRILALRLVGYGFEYPEFVIPCDTSDFFGTHIAICRELPGGGLVPIMAFKMLSLSRSTEFKQTFFATALASESADGTHGPVVAGILDAAGRSGFDIGYCCSWTIHPEIRTNKLLVAALRDAVYIAHGKWQEENRVPEMLIAGVVRFKTPAYQQTIGYEPLQLNGVELSTIAQRSLNGEPVAMLHMKSMSALTQAFAAKLGYLWDERIDFSAERLMSLPEAA